MPEHDKVCHGDFNRAILLSQRIIHPISLTGPMLPREMPVPMPQEHTFCSGFAGESDRADIFEFVLQKRTLRNSMFRSGFQL